VSGLRVANVFHAGDGNLHPLVLYTGAYPASRRLPKRFLPEFLELCIEAGGSITGEHGVGVE